MVRAQAQIVDWIAIPLAAAGMTATLFWGDDGLFHVIAAPIFVLLWRMTVLSTRRPNLATDDRRIQAHVANFHALGIVACVFLMAFETGVTAMAGSKVSDITPWLILSAATFVPFLIFSALSEMCLRAAHTNLSRLLD